MTAIDTLQGLFDAIPAPAVLATLCVPPLQRLVARAGLWPYALVALPGTLAHELAHYLMAALLGARPKLPRLWPTRTDRGWRLGSVAFVPRWWRTGAIALAPLALLPAAAGWLIAFTPGAPAALLLVHAWIAGTMLNASLPSHADLRLAGPTLLALGGAVVLGAVLHPAV